MSKFAPPLKEAIANNNLDDKPKSPRQQQRNNSKHSGNQSKLRSKYQLKPYLTPNNYLISPKSINEMGDSTNSNTTTNDAQRTPSKGVNHIRSIEYSFNTLSLLNALVSRQ
jgi:hypothetical protein